MKHQLDYFAGHVVAGLMNRREFLGRAAALGVTAAAANTMLADAVYAAGPQKGGTIKVGIQGGSSTDAPDPAAATNATATQLLRLWGDTLVGLGETGGLDGYVAESFEASADAKTWTFKIRKGLTFHNGQPLTAEDVMATLERHSGEDTKSGALGLLRDIVGMQAVGDEFIISLGSPNADLPYLMADYHLTIQPNGGNDDPNAMIGTGPYKMVEHEPGVRSVFAKNADYWDAENTGHAETIELTVINDDTARNSALQSGQVHMVNRVPPKVAGLISRMPGVEVRSTSGPGHYVFIMHCNTAPFDNKDLRLALKYAINRQEMVDKILFGYGSVGNDTPINASYPLFSDDMPQHEYDPDKAAHHFKASGHEGPILLRTSDNSFSGAPDASALFQQSASKAGITLDIKREPNDGYWSEVWNKQPFCTSYWGGRPVQDMMFSTAYLSTADWNDTRFFNDDFDKMLLSARGELDEAKRKATYRDMSLLLMEEGGLICPMFNDFIDATSDKLAGWVEGHKGFDLMDYRAPMKMWLTA